MTCDNHRSIFFSTNTDIHTTNIAYLSKLILKTITRSRRRALRQSRQLQHRVSSYEDVLSTAAREMRATGPETDRRVSQGAEAAAS